MKTSFFHAAFFVETIARPARDPRTRGLRRRTDGRVRAVAPLGLCTWPPGPTGRTPLSAHRPGWSSLFCCQAVGIADVGYGIADTGVCQSDRAGTASDRYERKRNPGSSTFSSFFSPSLVSPLSRARERDTERRGERVLYRANQRVASRIRDPTLRVPSVSVMGEKD